MGDKKPELSVERRVKMVNKQYLPVAFEQFLLTRVNTCATCVPCIMECLSESFHQQLIPSKTHNQVMTEETRTAASTETLSRKPLSSLGYPRPTHYNQTQAGVSPNH